MRILIAAVFSALLLMLHGTPVKKQVVHKASFVKKTAVAKPSATPKAVLPQPVKEAVQTVSTPTIPTTKTGMMAAAGIQPEDYGAADYIISHESSWRLYAVEPHTGAYGLCQSLPAVKMASVGSDWRTNPVTQLKWCNSYAETRYGGWWASYNHWVAYHWW